MLETVKRMLEFHQLNQSGQGVNGLPISLAQLNAGNSSEKRKNQIRQLLYSLYRYKKLTKNIYKSFVGII